MLIWDPLCQHYKLGSMAQLPSQTEHNLSSSATFPQNNCKLNKTKTNKITKKTKKTKNKQIQNKKIKVTWFISTETVCLWFSYFIISSPCVTSCESYLQCEYHNKYMIYTIQRKFSHLIHFFTYLLFPRVVIIS